MTTVPPTPTNTARALLPLATAALLGAMAVLPVLL